MMIIPVDGEALQPAHLGLSYLKVNLIASIFETLDAAKGKRKSQESDNHKIRTASGFRLLSLLWFSARRLL